jgi:hypothetical protein
MKNIGMSRLVKSLFQVTVFSLMLFSASTAYAYRFVVYADSRAVKGDPALFNREVLGFMNSQISTLTPKPAFALFLGDMVNRAWTTDYTHNNLTDWKAFMKAGLKKIPLYVAIGNTDLYGITGWTEYPLQDQFRQVFNDMPDNGPSQYKQLSYAFEYGKGKKRSLFVVMDAFGFYNAGGAWTNFDNGFDKAQIKWFSKTAKASDATHKFCLSHGPAFSVQGFPVQNSVREIWKQMEKSKFDMFYCGHEHIFSRWTINKAVYPLSTRKMTQTIVGSAGAVPDSASNVKVNPVEAHIYSGYTFVVVDVKDKKIIQRSYAVIPNGSGGFSTKLIDKFVVLK